MLRRVAVTLAGLMLAGAGPALAAVPAPAPPAAPVPAAAPATARVMPRWEYKLITYNRVALIGDSETELKLLGLQGWELVSAFFDPNARTIVCFLKRPI